LSPSTAGAATRWRDRVQATDWDSVRTELDGYGCALTGRLLDAGETAEIAALYTDDSRFRSTVDMGRYRFGQGEYRYFAEPFPDAVVALKQALYPRLLPIARDWWGRLGRPTPWPDTLPEWLEMCHTAGQQVVINLNDPGVDHTGGEFLLYEQRPRAQSRATATVIPHGCGLVFTTRDRPVQSTRGWSAAPVRHGVSVIRSGQRFTLGLVFHDAA